MRIAVPYRAPKVFLGLLIAEFPFTVAILALFGIAAPNTYRTKLWQDGADNGFNSSPATILYSYANYRPVSIPKVWSQFITDYNVVIAVLSMFIMLCKIIAYILHCWPPLLSVIVHCALVALYGVSVAYQSGSDTTDPDHPQNGAPWYITKDCDVAVRESNVGYCQQAKSAFAVSIIMLVIFAFHVILAVVSMIWARKPDPEEDEDILTASDEDAGLKSPEYRVPPSAGVTTPRMNPQTPRTLAFNKLGGTKDLPLRSHFSSPTPKSPTYVNHAVTETSEQYFPPPPKSGK